MSILISEWRDDRPRRDDRDRSRPNLRRCQLAVGPSGRPDDTVMLTVAATTSTARSDLQRQARQCVLVNRSADGMQPTGKSVAD
jgi:hypothetical protein